MSYLKIKRLLDIVISSFSLVVLSPILLVISLSLIDENEKVVFKQKRVGYKEKEFYIYKFRTIKHKDGKEVTSKYCKFLRKYGLDELLQIVNVLKGDMSMIGPRPRIKEYYNYFNAEQRSIIYQVHPGMFNPVVCENKEQVGILEKLDIERDYANNVSFKKDLGLIKEFIRNSKSILKNRKGIKTNIGTIEEEIKYLSFITGKDNSKLNTISESIQNTAIKTNKKIQIENLPRLLEIEEVKTDKSNNLIPFNPQDEDILKKVSNIDELLLKMIKVYNIAITNNIAINPYLFMIKSNNELVITKDSISPFSDDGTYRLYINIFLDHFMCLNFGRNIKNNEVLKEELERLNQKVIEMGQREYISPNFNLYSSDKVLNYYKLNIKNKENTKAYLLKM